MIVHFTSSPNLNIVNTAVGYQAMSESTSGSDNTAIGDSSIKNNTLGSGNTALGKNSIFNNTTGSLNVAIGRSALNSNKDGNNNVGVGYQALYSSSGDNNVGLGYQALHACTSGANNVSVGYQALNTLTTGTNVIAIGHNAQVSATNISNEITLGDANITRFRIPGLQASATSGDVLTYDDTLGIIKLQANSAITPSINNLIDGYSESGSIGLGSGSLANDNGTNNNNTAVGISGLAANTTGSGNIAIGYEALLVSTAGNTNTCIGKSAGASITGDSNTIVGALTGLAADVGVIRIGAGTTERVYVDSVGTVSGNAYRQSTNTLNGTAFIASSGGIQTRTIAANTTFTDSLNDGESIVVHAISGSSHTVTWPAGTTWLSSSGNYAPTLTDDDVLVFWKNDTTLFGAYAGSYA